jgi:CRISPR-associated endonuclease/helicase Cas3
MVSDISIYKSHPSKELLVHIIGVLKKSQRRTDLKNAEIAAIFHDVGKINPNFQVKINPDFPNEHNPKGSSYDEHSYLSVYAFLCFGKSNRQEFSSMLQNDLANLWSIVALIAHHHGNLPDFDKSILKETPLKKLEEFIKQNPVLPIAKFLEQGLKFVQSNFSLNETIQIFDAVVFKQDIWKNKALQNFMQTQFAFSSLIEADKRDASDNDSYYFEDNIVQSKIELINSLSSTFSKFKSETPLNKLRTQIRQEAVEGISIALKRNHRLFELTAPTGAGKTYALLSVACEIQKQKGNFGIIYALPFLSITEQVQEIVSQLLSDILSVNSKSQNERIDKSQQKYETEQTTESLKELLQEDFIQQTFDHPFVITTFVQLFETLLSNHNSTLLKLPNFANRIFLIDEIQSLPPKLYVFFTAWLDEFCRQNNSYAVLSTATMPNFRMLDKGNMINYINPNHLFTKYQEPSPILEAKKFFQQEVFNRYQINLIDENNFIIDKLGKHIETQEQSCLVILNTIADTKQLYSYLKENNNCILLNTNFIPEDRTIKIELVKKYQISGEKVILISTQLIEAGVDIDFPIVYRDLCPLPSLIQSAGRCNRNKKLSFGQVWFFQLTKENGKQSAELIYRDEAKQFLNFIRTEIKTKIEERDLFEIQRRFFDYVSKNLIVGEFEIGTEKYNMIECVQKGEFETLGKFRLIPENKYGTQFQYYIRKDYDDESYEELIELMFKSIKSEDYEEKKKYKIVMNQKMKAMSKRILQVRIYQNKDNEAPNYTNINKEYFNIRVLADLNDYNFQTGLNIKGYTII